MAAILNGSAQMDKGYLPEHQSEFSVDYIGNRSRNWGLDLVHVKMFYVLPSYLKHLP